ncbi:hypothetical protein [Nocardiopsis sp. FR26]|uniref:hypothetical protein n=1 Tax=Nocardiopsis sp. FR26 TaxID=2605987 RepID=UPI00135C9612|nr:hypothetical protein [Nocardiopsis sp. FR26]
MIETANIAASVVFLIVGIILWLSKTWPKVQLILLLLAGAGMTAGVVGGGFRDGVAGLMSAVDNGMVWAFGAPAPGLLAVAAAVFIFLGWRGSTGWMKKGSRFIPHLSALAAPLIWHMTGGIFGPLALIIGSLGSVIGTLLFGSMGLTY